MADSAIDVGEQGHEADLLKTTTRQFTKGVLTWLAGTVVICWAASLMASMLSPELKRLVLLPAVYGAVAGGLSGWWGQRAELTASNRWVLILLGACVLSGSIHTTWLSFREFQQAATQAAKNPQTALALRVLESDSDAVAQARREELQASIDPSLSDYLRHRVRQLGRVSPRFAVGFWFLEAVVALVAAVIVFRKTTFKPTA